MYGLFGSGSAVVGTSTHCPPSRTAIRSCALSADTLYETPRFDAAGSSSRSRPPQPLSARTLKTTFPRGGPGAAGVSDGSTCSRITLVSWPNVLLGTLLKVALPPDMVRLTSPVCCGAKQADAVFA